MVVGPGISMPELASRRPSAEVWVISQEASGFPFIPPRGGAAPRCRPSAAHTAIVGQASLDRAIVEFVAHYHDERSHQGIGNEIVSGATPQRIGQIEVKERLGELLNHYHRRAA